MNKLTKWLLLGGLFSSLFSCQTKQEKIKPQYKELVESVYASATVVPEDLYQVYSTASGVLINVLVEEGDTVVVNQIIAEIEAEEPQLNAANAALNSKLSNESYTGAASILSRIKDEIRVAEDQFKIDSLNYSRQQRLAAKNIGSQVELENRKLKYEASVNQLASLRSKLKETDRELRNQFKISNNELNKALSRLEDYSIKSRINGRVYSLLKNEGEQVSTQQVFAEIGRRESFVLKMLIDEVDISKLEVGQRTLVSLDAFADTTFEAEISKIYPSKDERTQTFTVEGVFRTAPRELYNGLAGEANIIVSKTENVLVIPSEYLMEGNWVKTKDKEVEVTIGRRNMEWLEITTGLDTNSVLIKP
jgi:multidrug efflux pump subunit AcrA (membrane-fusion protein)